MARTSLCFWKVTQMETVISCPHCNRRIKVTEIMDGRRGTCPGCNQMFVVRIPEASIPTEKLPENPITLQYEDEEAKSKECPYCGEEIKRIAKKCKHCGEILDSDLREIEELKRSRKKKRRFRDEDDYDDYDDRDDRGTNQQVVIHQSDGRRGRNDFPHTIHLVLTIFTCGAWLPVWVIHYLVWSS